MTRDYYGTKRVTAWHSDKDGQEGYGVKYNDGYVSWSPKKVFEATYQPLDALSFGHAIEALKAGEKVRRSGWVDSTEKYRYLIGNFSFLSDENRFFILHVSNAGVDPYSISQSDALANDWQVIGEV